MSAERYRPVHTKVWADGKFNALSDDGKMVWLLLLTAPSLSPIPGVIVAGEATLADMLGWTLERYRKGYREGLAKGFAMASEGRLVWLRNGLRHQPPTNVNAAKYWATGWSEIPECALKRELWKAIKDVCLEWWEALADRYPEPLGEGYQEGYPKVPGYQEQEQKQDIPRPKARAKSIAGDLPETWGPTANHIETARTRGVALDLEADRFRAHAATHERKAKNWNAAFTSWLLKAYPDRQGSLAAATPLSVNVENYR